MAGTCGTSTRFGFWIVSKFIFLAFLFFLGLAGACESSAQELRYVKKLAPPGSTYSFAAGINQSSSLIVGAFTNAAGEYIGYAYNGDRYEDIVFPGTNSFTQARGVNDSNAVVGSFIGLDLLSHGFILRGKSFQQFDAQAGSSTQLYDINNDGNLVGFAGNDGNDQGFIRVGNKVTMFNFEGNTTQAFGINAENDVVGIFIPPPFSGSHGFVRTANGTMTQIDFPGAASTTCLGINDLGEISGLYVDSQNVSHGFIYREGKFKTLASPDAWGINDAGVVVGSYVGEDNMTYGFVAASR